jgi:hypothetical protein
MLTITSYPTCGNETGYYSLILLPLYSNFNKVQLYLADKADAEAIWEKY